MDLPPQKVNWKKIVCQAAVFAVLTSIWIALSYSIALIMEQRNILPAIASAVLLIIIIPLVALAAIILPRRIYLPLSGLLALLTLVFFPPGLLSLLAAGILFMGLARAYHRANFELSNHVKFSSTSVTRRVGDVVILSLMLAVSVHIYAITARQINEDPDLFANQLSNSATRSLLPIIERQLPGFERSVTLDQYLISALAGSYESYPISDAERDRLIHQNRQTILQQFGIEATGQEPLSEIVRRAVAEKVRDLFGRFGPYLPLIYTIAILSVLRLVSFLLSCLAQAWGLLFFWILRRIHFLKVTTTQILAEHIDI